ncbi:PEP-CTERM sorting domain-containing protein [Calycomorphotria hydatis]|uniref:PEP-CTERM motif protein n=1 Tax=Calycomorphotria hydatis TaxID=2528027 RepID=A0A517T4U7_9PLAN|nr:PEP-CTERM sorting domain-containing protein [Calycomorphotria hydatis]QDT63397.1 PEP-CTERM motif protein [Calycomorphotria hydatis]
MQIKNLSFMACCIASFYVLMSSAQAALIVELEGTTGDSVIDILISGSVSASSNTSTSGYSLESSTDDFIQTFIGSSPITSGSLSIDSQSTSTSSIIDDIFLDIFSDEIRLRFPSSVSFLAGEVFDFSGSAQFTLASGTFDSVFNLGTFNNVSPTFSPFVGNGGTIIISERSEAIVPEPTSIALAGLGVMGLFVAARRRQKCQS